MRRHVVVLSMLLGVVVPAGFSVAAPPVLCGVGTVSRTSFQTSYRSYLAIGDSMTSGASFDPQAALPGYVRYTDLVAQWLTRRQRAPLAYANMAQNGDKAAEGGVARIDGDLAAHRPDLVTAMYGTTDLVIGRDVADFRSALDTIVGKISAQSGARALLATIPPWGPASHVAFGTAFGPNNLDRLAGTDVRIHAYNAAIKDVAADRRLARVADVYASFERDPSKLALDGVHPSAAGHAQIAAELIARLDEVTDRGEGGVQLPAGSRAVSLEGGTAAGTFTSAVLRPLGNAGWRDLTVAVTVPAGSTVRLEAAAVDGGATAVGTARPGDRSLRLALGSLPVGSRTQGIRVRATLERTAGQRGPAITRLDARFTQACDATAPVVTGLAPAEGHAGLESPPVIAARFDRAMDPASLTATGAMRVRSLGPVAVAGTPVDPRTDVPGRVSYDAARHAAVFTPSAPLSPGREYVVTIAPSARDLVGTALDYPVQWVFSTLPVATF